MNAFYVPLISGVASKLDLCTKPSTTPKGACNISVLAMSRLLCRWLVFFLRVNQPVPSLFVIHGALAEDIIRPQALHDFDFDLVAHLQAGKSRGKDLV